MTWVKVYNASFDSLSKTFKTHLNYVKCMDKLTNGIGISISINPTAHLNPTRIRKFEQLAKITKTSIEGELRACTSQKAYAQVASPWIPVKCYYYLYYLESIFMYLLSASEIGFRHGGHKGIREGLASSLKSNQIIFTGPQATSFSTIVTWATAESFKTSGSTIDPHYFLCGDCDKSLRGKLAEYIEIDWKQSKRIKDYRTKAAKNSKVVDLMPTEFSLIDYFYWMRIKSNYRDLDFLDFDNNVNESDAFEFLTYYIRSTFKYADALLAAITSLKPCRGC